MSTIQDKAKQLLQLRLEAEKAKLVLSGIIVKKNEIQNELMSAMSNEGFNSVKIDKTSISKAIRKTLMIRDEEKLIKDLKKRNLGNEYVCETVRRDLWKGLSAAALKGNETFEGTEAIENEYISIRTAK